jgi:hypothetical protein
MSLSNIAWIVLSPACPQGGFPASKIVLEPITPEVIRESNERGAATANAPTAILHAEVAAVDGVKRLRFIFRDGSRLSVPVSRIEELENASEEVLGALEVAPSRDSVAFPLLDVNIYVPGLLADLFGTQALAEEPPAKKPKAA